MSNEGFRMRSTWLLGTLLTCATMAAVPVAASDLEVGEPFPAWVLPSLEGEPMSISSFRGQKVVLHVFASW